MKCEDFFNVEMMCHLGNCLVHKIIQNSFSREEYTYFYSINLPDLQLLGSGHEVIESILDSNCTNKR